MKNMLITALLLASMSCLNAQTKNNEGLYTDGEGNLFTGKMTTRTELRISEFEVREGMVEGEVKYYYASGQLMETGSFVKGQKNDKWTRYSETGNIEAIAFYKLGKKSGTWLVYDDKGKKRFEMNYENGEKTGTWTSWDENGAVASVKDYGKLN